MRIGIDLGGTKIEGVALSSAGAEQARLRVPTPRDYAGSVEAIAGVVQELERRAGATGTVGVGIPGAVVPATGRVKNANSVWLNGRPLGDDLAARLGRPVRLMNDANCFALSEAADGAAEGAPVVFGVILGTGVGGGIVVDGRCLVGANLIAGEWGHTPLPTPADDERPGPPCYCGRRGCVETFLSGPGLAADHARHTGVEASTHDVVLAAGAGDAAAVATMRRYVARLARALAGVVNVLDPDVVVLGGGMSNVPGLADAVAAELPPHVFSDSVATRVVRNRHGDSSGVRGAAWLWPAGGLRGAVTDHRAAAFTVRALAAHEARARIAELSAVLVDCVEGGASVSFMAPLARETADRFWHGVADGVAAGDRVLLAAVDAASGEVAGTVQVVFAWPENQPHRADVAKMLVRRSARRQGLAALLMRAAEAAARGAGRTLLVLDTVTGSAAERLYARLGWTRVGVVPRYALWPDGRPCDTTIFYKRLGEQPGAA